MLLENIPIGKTLEIYVDREEYRYRFISKVEDTNELRVCVTAITSGNGRFFDFLPEDRVSVVYRDEDVMWEWTHVEPGLAQLDEYPIHFFKIRDKGSSFNRRNAYRVKLLEEIMIGFYRVPGKLRRYAEIPVLPVDEGLSQEERELWEERVSRPVMVRAMIKDVSENGIGIYSDEELETEDEIFFGIPSSYGNLMVKAAVVRKTRLQSVSSHYDFYYGCALTKTDRRLLRYIFELQREMLKKQREMNDN